jgi:hypothetical protein
MAQSHVSALFSVPSFAPRTARLEARCSTSGIVGTAIARMVKSMRATATTRAMDGGEYIGFRNGVYDLNGDRFIPNEQVHYSVLVSMSTRYDYVAAEACPQETIDEIKEFLPHVVLRPERPERRELGCGVAALGVAADRGAQVRRGVCWRGRQREGGVHEPHAPHVGRLFRRHVRVPLQAQRALQREGPDVSVRRGGAQGRGPF